MISLELLQKSFRTIEHDGKKYVLLDDIIAIIKKVASADGMARLTKAVMFNNSKEIEKIFVEALGNEKSL